MSIDDYRKMFEKQNRGKAASSEHALQVACVNWFRYAHPQYSHLLMAIPNGGYRTQTTAKLMKAEGQLAGVPDIFLPVARDGFHGLWIEMKNGKAGRVSDSQKDMISRLKEQGYRCEICRTEDEFIETINSYL